MENHRITGDRDHKNKITPQAQLHIRKEEQDHLCQLTAQPRNDQTSNPSVLDHRRLARTGSDCPSVGQLYIIQTFFTIKNKNAPDNNGKQLILFCNSVRNAAPRSFHRRRKRRSLSSVPNVDTRAVKVRRLLVAYHKKLKR